MIHIAIILVSVAVVQWRFRRDSADGLAAAVFLLLLLPVEVKIQLPGALPELTAHRVLLLLLAYHFWAGSMRLAPRVALPGLPLLMIVAALRGVSMILADDFGPALKTWLSFLIETCLFYVIMTRCLADQRTAIRVLWAAAGALFVIAAVATVERWQGTNLAARLIPGMIDNGRSVTATFRHRIQLGYALAMGFPILLALKSLARTQLQQRIAAVGILFIPAACYFSNSRGPWVGLVVAGVVMAFTGSRLVRKRLAWLGVLAAVVLIARPGVFDTIRNLALHSFSTGTQKGRSASYRMELWRVAYSELSRSPDRFLFGFGGGSLQSMDLGTSFEFGGGAGALGYTSWDSEYAADFMQYGFLGFLAELAMFGFFCRQGYRAWQGAQGIDGDLAGACLAALAVLLWAMTNVAIFNPQLWFLFWTAAAVGVRMTLPRWGALRVRKAPLEIEEQGQQAEAYRWQPTAG